MDNGSNTPSVRRNGPLPSAPADVDDDGTEALDFFEDSDEFDFLDEEDDLDDCGIFYDDFWDWHTDPDCAHGFAYGDGCTACDWDDYDEEQRALKYRPVEWPERTRQAESDFVESQMVDGTGMVSYPFTRQQARHERAKQREAARRHNTLTHRRRAVRIASIRINKETFPDNAQSTDRGDRQKLLTKEPWRARFTPGKREYYDIEQEFHRKKLIRKAPLL